MLECPAIRRIRRLAVRPAAKRGVCLAWGATVRMAAKREAVQALGGVLIESSISTDRAHGKAN